MMNEILVLDKNTIDQIAAGEVIERPSSIVKELVENSMDAGAKAISVEIRDGGKALIRVTDNGSGIQAGQVTTAFLRHSTSKIRDARDLSFIHSFGFRGEALSSIAAVSRTELCTKTKEQLTGTIYRMEGGDEVSLQEAGLPDGTTVIVRDLFYNTPARLKFLKSPQTESGYVLDLMQRIALSHPEISFKFVSNGAAKLSTSGNGSLRDAIYAIFGKNIASNLLEIHGTGQNLSVNGFISKPEIARGNRSFEYYFVNGRYIKDRIVQRALEEAYVGYQMKGAFPFCVLDIQMEPELVDVNVHPSKLEVRFFHGEAVFQEIYEILRDHIVGRENIPETTLPLPKPSPKEQTPKPEGPEDPATPEPLEVPADSGEISEEMEEPKKSYIPEPYESAARRQWKEQTRHFEEHTDYGKGSGQQTIFLSKEARPKHRIVGVVFDTYWIVELEDKMYLIDQHAAHEKVLYERFIKKLDSEKHYSQQILPAAIVTLSSQEETILESCMETLQAMGFEIAPFGGSEYAITEVPTDFYSLDPRQMLMEMLGDLTGISAASKPEMLKDRVATAACKAAVKGGNRLSFSEASALIDELLELENPYHCPHGRPTIISMSRYELEKRFKRIV